MTQFTASGSARSAASCGAREDKADREGSGWRARGARAGPSTVVKTLVAKSGTKSNDKNTATLPVRQTTAEEDELRSGLAARLGVRVRLMVGI